jgi:hypothetical protein
MERSNKLACYIEIPAEYGVVRIEFDSGALISHEYEPDSHTDIFVLDAKQTSFKQHGLREGDHVRVHYEKGNNGWDFEGKIDDINNTFITIMMGRFDEQR